MACFFSKDSFLSLSLLPLFGNQGTVFKLSIWFRSLISILKLKISLISVQYRRLAIGPIDNLGLIAGFRIDNLLEPLPIHGWSTDLFEQIDSFFKFEPKP